MYGIDILIKEHEHITQLNQVVKRVCGEILDGAQVEVDFFYQVIDFVRNYADKHHHGKEEKILFQVMEEQLGQMAKNLIRHGMLVEHDLGRLYMAQLEDALQRFCVEQNTTNKLDIIVNAAGYTDLLKRHIEKENEVLFTFAKRSLEEKNVEIINQRTKEFEDMAMTEGIQDKYLSWLEGIKE